MDNKSLKQVGPTKLKTASLLAWAFSDEGNTTCLQHTCHLRAVLPSRRSPSLLTKHWLVQSFRNFCL